MGKNDTLSFDIPPLAASGYYQEHLGLRITGAYPFMGLTLIVEQSIYPDSHNRKEKTVKIDTIQCKLIDKNGATTGQGISYYQYNFPINVYQLNKNDSIHVTIRHDMKREILPGISDIGLKVVNIKEKSPLKVLNITEELQGGLLFYDFFTKISQITQILSNTSHSYQV